MGRRKSDSEGLMDLLFVFAELSWKAGIAISLVSAFLTYKSYECVSTLLNDTKSTLITALIEQIAPALYLLPIVMLCFTVVFSLRTYRTYRNINRI